MKIFSSAQQKLAGRKGTYTKLLFIKSAKTLNQKSYVMCISASTAPSVQANWNLGRAVRVYFPAKVVLLTNLPFILGLFSAFNFLTSYLIFLENNLVLRFSLYLDTLASRPPSTIAGCAPSPLIISP